MTQQINLYSPILLAPRRYFSARAMLLSLGVFALLLAAVCAWMQLSSSALRRDLHSSVQAQTAERERLTQALAVRPAASGVALEQELAQQQQLLVARRALLDELTRGRTAAGRSHAAMLRMVAQTVPASVWLTEIRLVEGRLELIGMTLQPEALRPWLVQLGQHALTADQRLAAVKLERVTTGANASAGRPLPAGAQAWAFQLLSQSPQLYGTETVPAGSKP